MAKLKFEGATVRAIAAHDAELRAWIAYIETGLPDLTDTVDREDFLIEVIHKALRRNVISPGLAYDLADNFNVLEAF